VGGSELFSEGSRESRREDTGDMLVGERGKSLLKFSELMSSF